MKAVVVTVTAFFLSWAPSVSAATRYDPYRTRLCIADVAFGTEGNSGYSYPGQIELTGDITWWFSVKDDGEVILFTRREAAAVRIFRELRHRALAHGLTVAQARQVTGHQGNAVWGPNTYTAAEAKEAIALHVGTKIRSCLR